jgi:hypothetical protein
VDDSYARDIYPDEYVIFKFVWWWKKRHMKIKLCILYLILKAQFEDFIKRHPWTIHIHSLYKMYWNHKTFNITFFKSLWKHEQNTYLCRSRIIFYRMETLKKHFEELLGFLFVWSDPGFILQ